MKYNQLVSKVHEYEQLQGGNEKSSLRKFSTFFRSLQSPQVKRKLFNEPKGKNNLNMKSLKIIPIGKIFPQQFSYECISNYISGKGWEAIVKIYKAGKEIEFLNEELENTCKISKDKVPGILYILGAIRKYVIKQVFEETKTYLKLHNTPRSDVDNTQLIAPGSDNLTSDYDVTINGPIASKFILRFFLLFLQKFGSLPPIAFDSNLYPGTASFNSLKGMHPSILSNPIMKTITIGSNQFVFPLNYKLSDNNVLSQLVWVFCKLSKTTTSYQGSSSKLMQQLLHMGAELESKLQSIFCESKMPSELEKILETQQLIGNERKAKLVARNYYYHVN